MAIRAPHADQLAAIPVREGEFSLLGSTSRYWDYGPEDATHTLVLCHGYRGDHHGLEPVIARLPGVRVISPDLPGFGASTPMTEANHDVAGYARWFTEFVDRLGQTGTAIVVGHSFGSMITSRAIADVPQMPTATSHRWNSACPASQRVAAAQRAMRSPGRAAPAR